MDWLSLSEKLIWFGFASLGFAVLFNVPARTLPFIWLMGAVAGGVKSIVMESGGEVIAGSFAGATLAGFLSIRAAHTRHSPPMVFAIPAVIPLVPGAFAYRAMLGIIKLARYVDQDNYGEMLNQTVNNGLKTFFVLMALALGVSLPMLITRRDTAKEIRMPVPKIPKDSEQKG